MGTSTFFRWRSQQATCGKYKVTKKGEKSIRGSKRLDFWGTSLRNLIEFNSLLTHQRTGNWGAPLVIPFLIDKDSFRGESPSTLDYQSLTAEGALWQRPWKMHAHLGCSLITETWLEVNLQVSWGAVEKGTNDICPSPLS
jgi:hypothetical protein